MAVISCLECGGTVSEHADTCPHCGIKEPGELHKKIEKEKSEEEGNTWKWLLGLATGASVLGYSVYRKYENEAQEKKVTIVRLALMQPETREFVLGRYFQCREDLLGETTEGCTCLDFINIIYELIDSAPNEEAAGKALYEVAMIPQESFWQAMGWIKSHKSYYKHVTMTAKISKKEEDFKTVMNLFRDSIFLGN